MGVVENAKLTVAGAGNVGASLAYAALIRGSARHDLAGTTVRILESQAVLDVTSIPPGTIERDPRTTGTAGSGGRSSWSFRVVSVAACAAG